MEKYLNPNERRHYQGKGRNKENQKKHRPYDNQVGNEQVSFFQACTHNHFLPFTHRKHPSVIKSLSNGASSLPSSKLFILLIQYAEVNTVETMHVSVRQILMLHLNPINPSITKMPLKVKHYSFHKKPKAVIRSPKQPISSPKQPISRKPGIRLMSVPFLQSSPSSVLRLITKWKKGY